MGKLECVMRNARCAMGGMGRNGIYDGRDAMGEVGVLGGGKIGQRAE